MSKPSLAMRMQYTVIDAIDHLRCKLRGHEYEYADNGQLGVWNMSGMICVTCGKADEEAQIQIDASLDK